MSSPARILPSEATDFTRDALRGWVIGTTSDAQLRGALRQFCDISRRQRLQPEEALVAFKAMCRSIPEVCDARKRDANADLIARAVTMWIGEYYGTAGSRPIAEGDAPAA